VARLGCGQGVQAQPAEQIDGDGNGRAQSLVDLPGLGREMVQASVFGGADAVSDAGVHAVADVGALH
jgi:hypothetical protein